MNKNKGRVTLPSEENFLKETKNKIQGSIDDQSIVEIAAEER